MIIRKPYAFLIKNFKKIHIFMFLLCAYIYYKSITLSAFINEFLEYFSYDKYNEPISKYTGFFSILFLLLVIAASITLVILLKHKKKPWKLYLLPAIEYTALLITFSLASSFFNNYAGSLETTTVRALRDIMFILTIPQYGVFALLAIRIFGVDLNKFDFKSDAEYIEMSESDREEIEINIDIDKESFKRLYKKLIRNLGYFYQEHKKIVHVAAAIIVVIVGYKSYQFIFVTNKSYTQGDIINTNAYEIKINNSYYSDKDYKGEKISEGNSFIILNITIKNNAQKRTVNFNRFHIMNRTANYSQTNKLYETQFKDLGTAVSDLTLESGREATLNLIYKVSSKENIKRYVLYYQELNGNEQHLRKIKLKLDDISEIKDNEKSNLGDVLTIKMPSEEREVIFDNSSINDVVSYSKKNCTDIGCSISSFEQSAKTGTKILKIDFASNDFAGKDMIDFLSNYGKINYRKNSKTKKSISIKNALNTEEYYGKYVYITVPQEITDALEIDLVITARNNRYTYKLK